MGNLVCLKCSQRFDLNKKIWECPCGGVLDIELSPSLDFNKLQYADLTIWRYKDALPLQEEDNIVSYGEGFTPLTPIDFGGSEILVKLDYLFPSGSFKDRGASVLLSKIKELGINEVVEDSSGNAGAAIAAYSAKAGINCEVFVPAYTPPEKTTQIQSYGADLIKVEGSREDTARAAYERAQELYYASHYRNPFFIQGMKTFSFEIWEQLNQNPPDRIILPIGNGSLLMGAYKGFNELLEQGLIDELPSFIGVQAENCAPISSAFNQNLNSVPPVKKEETLAEGISISNPPLGKEILQAIKNTDGEMITVAESEIREALKSICEDGYFIEATSAAVVSGIKKYLKNTSISPTETIISTFTGSGLKNTEKILNVLSVD